VRLPGPEFSNVLGDWAVDQGGLAQRRQLSRLVGLPGARPLRQTSRPDFLHVSVRWASPKRNGEAPIEPAVLDSLRAVDQRDKRLHFTGGGGDAPPSKGNVKLVTEWFKNGGDRTGANSGPGARKRARNSGGKLARVGPPPRKVDWRAVVGKPRLVVQMGRAPPRLDFTSSDSTVRAAGR